MAAKGCVVLNDAQREDLKDQVEAYVTQCGVTREALAKRAGISRSSLHNWTRSGWSINRDDLFRLGKVLEQAGQGITWLHELAPGVPAATCQGNGDHAETRCPGEESTAMDLYPGCQERAPHPIVEATSEPSAQQPAATGATPGTAPPRCWPWPRVLTWGAAALGLAVLLLAAFRLHGRSLFANPSQGAKAASPAGVMVLRPDTPDKEEIRLRSEAIAQRRQEPPSEALAFDLEHRSEAYARLGQRDLAAADLREAVRMREQLTPRSDQLATDEANLATDLTTDTREKLELLTQAIVLRRSMAPAEPLAFALEHRSAAYRQTGQGDLAKVDLKEAIGIRRALGLTGEYLNSDLENLGDLEQQYPRIARAFGQ